MHEIIMHHLIKNTDLAVEAYEMITRHVDDSVPGVNMASQRFAYGTVHRTEVQNDQGAQQIGKPLGRYITLEVPVLRKRDPKTAEHISKMLAQEIANLVNLPVEASVLVVGLGNWKVTPDALGPRVVEDLMVTRHLFEHVPEEIGEGVRSVAALTPGVMGVTGVESGEIIHGVAQHVKPECIICVDALAARSTTRVNTTIQLSDTGIHPGSGVGNKRMAITQETIGVPVIAIGVPTVVHAVTIAYDAIGVVLNRLKVQGRDLSDELMSLEQGERFGVVNDILQPYVGELMVTPKEVDALIADTAIIVAEAINAALHPSMAY